jgi:hypothetical protein
MKSLFSRLLQTCSRRRGAARPVRRRTNLSVEQLDERLVPSVTPTLTNTGQLQLVATGNDNVTVTTGIAIN